MSFGKELNVLLYVLFGSFDTLSTILSVLYMIGLWRLFVKCGLKGWWALVPIVKYYKLALCADREQEGRTVTLLHTVVTLVYIVNTYMEPGSVPYFFCAIVDAASLPAVLIYSARIYSGLCRVFERRRWWVLLWLVAELFPVAPLLWGFRKKYQPLWLAEEIRDDADYYFSGRKAAILDQGLTVNLEERTAREFFKKKYLLRNIHLSIQPGHMVLLLGGSGAGKTTFLNAVNGYEPAKAEVTINGRNMYKNYKEMQYDIGFVPQADLIRGCDTVYRTLMDTAMLRLPNSFSHAERNERVEEVMDIFGLTPVKGNLVSKLSGGQRKRLSIAMEFISNPTLFILDEPDSGLDGVMARELFTQLRKIADQGKIIIVITHTPDRVIDLFDDVIVLAKDAKRTGRLAWFGPIDEARAFFGKEKMEEIVKSVNREEEGGEGRADEFILKYAEVQHV
jgi:ABC-type multidrug transport system ATPase subunit